MVEQERVMQTAKQPTSVTVLAAKEILYRRSFFKVLEFDPNLPFVVRSIYPRTGAPDVMFSVFVHLNLGPILGVIT